MDLWERLEPPALQGDNPIRVYPLARQPRILQFGLYAFGDHIDSEFKTNVIVSPPSVSKTLSKCHELVVHLTQVTLRGSGQARFGV